MPAMEDRLKVCQACGKQYFGAFNSKYCHECKRRTCPVCGKEFVATPTQMTQVAMKGWVTCSRSCGQRWRDLKYQQCETTP